ncbi:MAG: sulfite exporter TauE/SafE family protein [Flavobacteriales bacterium]|jgi:uncharacterized membrane protein YfcA
MSLQEILSLVCIGIVAGILSGFVGVGGGIVIVPALVYAMGFTQHQAQGTSLFVLAMPVVLLAVMNYAKTGNVNWKFGLVIAGAFIVGGYVGSKLSLRLPAHWVKITFGLIMAYVSFKLLLSGFQTLNQHET